MSIDFLPSEIPVLATLSRRIEVVLKLPSPHTWIGLWCSIGCVRVSVTAWLVNLALRLASKIAITSPRPALRLSETVGNVRMLCFKLRYCFSSVLEILVNPVGSVNKCHPSMMLSIVSNLFLPLHFKILF